LGRGWCQFKKTPGTLGTVRTFGTEGLDWRGCGAFWGWVYCHKERWIRGCGIWWFTRSVRTEKCIYLVTSYCYCLQTQSAPIICHKKRRMNEGWTKDERKMIEGSYLQGTCIYEVSMKYPWSMAGVTVSNPGLKWGGLYKTACAKQCDVIVFWVLSFGFWFWVLGFGFRLRFDGRDWRKGTPGTLGTWGTRRLDVVVKTTPNGWLITLIDEDGAYGIATFSLLTKQCEVTLLEEKILDLILLSRSIERLFYFMPMMILSHLTHSFVFSGYSFASSFEYKGRNLNNWQREFITLKSLIDRLITKEGGFFLTHLANSSK